MTRTHEVRAGSTIVPVDDDEGGSRPILVVGPWAVGPIEGWRVLTMRAIDAALELAVADVGAVIRSLGLGDVVLVGGWPVAAYASRSPGVHGLVLLDEPLPIGLDSDGLLATVGCPIVRVGAPDAGAIAAALTAMGQPG